MNKYTIINDNFNSPFIISLPHSGTYIPENIKKKFNDNLILSNSDWFLPELYDFLLDTDITMIINNLNRYVIDVNRKIERRDTRNYRTSLVFHKTAYGKVIYKHDLSRKDIEERIKFYYEPYHQALNALIQHKLKIFKKVYLLDLHSYYLPQEKTNKILISNNNGLASSKETFNSICSVFQDSDLEILRNKIFLGGYITKYYSKKYKNKVECIQIELPYNLYIEDRAFGEEEIHFYNEDLFNELKVKLKNIFINLQQIFN